MIMRKPGFVFALAALALGLVVVILGAYTRLVHAGLGCPDWPGCYGFLSVPRSDTALELAQQRFPEAPVESFKAWAEMIHRYAAGLLGLTILGLALLALKQRGRDGYPLKLPLGLLALVICQALFGMWTVTLKLWPQVVTAHLLGGFATLSLLWLLVQRFSAWRWRLSPLVLSGLQQLRPLVYLALVLVIGQIALGGWVSANYAALACVDFPRCHNEWWPEMDFVHAFNLAQTVGPNYLGGLLEGEARTAIHVSHHIKTLLITLVLGTLCWRLWRLGVTLIRRQALVIALVLVLQLILGASNILFSLPLAVAVTHNAVGALLLLTLIFLTHRLETAQSERPDK